MQMPFASVGTAISQDAVGGSSIANGTTMMQFDRRQPAVHCALGTTATLCGRQEPSPLDMHDLSTCHHPRTSRFLVAQGDSLHDQPQRVSCTPDMQGGSTAQPMSQRIIRLSCSLAVVV